MMKKFKDLSRRLALSRTDWLLLGAILLAAAALRLNGMTWGLPTKTLSLTTYHADEAYVFQSFENMVRTRSLHPGREGLLYGTLHFYLAGAVVGLAKVCDFVHIGSRAYLLSHLPNLDRMYLVIRLLSAVCVVASVFAIFFLGRKIFDRRAGLWAAFLMAFSPISIAISHYAKVDALLPFLVVILLWFTLRMAEEPSLELAVICGSVVGLLASTRYNAGILLLVPLFASGISSSGRKWALYAAVLSASFLAFILTTPYAVLDFPLFFACLKGQGGMMSASGIWEMGYPSRFSRAVLYYIPFGFGWAPAVLALIGMVWMAAGLFYRKNEKRMGPKVLLFGFFVVFMFFYRMGHKLTSHVTSLLPFLSLLGAVGIVKLEERVSKKYAAIALIAVFCVYQGLYALSFSRLFSDPNPRELAGEWIEANVPRTTTIGISRSYFWTPGILRQATPPYPLVKAIGDTEPFHTAALSLKNLKPLPEYFVISELELRDYFRIEGINPVYAQALRQFFVNYEPVQSFSLQPTIFGIHFWKRMPPWDYSTIAPEIVIYRKRPGVS